MGIEKENIPLLFDRFYRGDSARSYRDNNNSNTGLGLAIARAIVESHHGNIKVESNAGEGTNFMVTLPKKIGT